MFNMAPKNMKVPGTLNNKGRWYYILALMIVLGLGVSYAFAELIIPSGSTVDVNTGTLEVSGDIDLSGTLASSSGRVALTGDWNNAGVGTYTPGTGTLDFDGTGAQLINSGGTVAGKLLYNLEISGTGTKTVNAEDLNIDNNFTISNAGATFDVSAASCDVGTAACDLTIAGIWNNVGTYTARTGTVTFDGTNQSILGSTNFYNITKQLSAAPTRTLIFDHAGEQIVDGLLRLRGFNAASRLVLNSNDDDVTPSQAGLTLRPGGTQDIAYVDVKNNDASGANVVISGITLVAGSTSVNSGNNLNWLFGAATLTWQGDLNGNWDTPGNWDLGFVPGSGDSVLIPSGTTNSASLVSIVGAGVTVDDMTVDAGATVFLANKNLTVSDTLSNEGTVSMFGNQAVSIANIDSDTGTFTITGDGDGIAETFTIPDIGANDYYNLVINDPTAISDTFQTNNNLTILNSLTVTDGAMDISTNANLLTVTNDLTVNGGVLTATLGDIDVNDDLSLTSGTLTAPNGSNTFTLAGDFTHNGGTLTHSSGTLTLDGANQALLGTANTTFSTLLKNQTTASATLTFPTTSIKTIANHLDLTGTSAFTLFINSDTVGNDACIELLSAGTMDLDYLEVRDSDASGTCGGGSGAGAVKTLIARHSTQPNANNTNWIFGGVTLTWQGDDLVTPTDWNDPSNWDLGIVPDTADDIIIPNVVNDPVLATDVSIDELTLGAGATLTLSGNDLTATGTFSNDGTVILIGNETVTLTQDVNSGTFQYIGNGSTTTRTIIDFGATDYYNLIINGTGGTPDVFQSNGDLTAANNVTVTAGTLNVSTNVDTLTVGAALTINGGTLTATNGNIDANGTVIISSGTLTAPASGQSFTIADDLTFSGGTFTHSSGTVTLDSAAAATIAGNMTFNNLTSTTGGKNIIFTAGSNQTIVGTLTIQGASGNNIVLSSSVGGSAWTLTVPSTQSALFVTVSDADAAGADIFCFSCTNALGNDNLAASPHWVFSTLAINTPQVGKTVDTTPTIIGTGTPSVPVIIRDISNNIVATVTPDASGNFMTEISSANALALGANSLTPWVGALAGATVNINVELPPALTTDEQPTITSHADNDRVHGGTPTIAGLGLASQAVSIYAYDTGGNLLVTTVGSGSVNVSSAYSVTLSTTLFKGLNYLAVVVDGVASDIVELKFTDPFGVVFDSRTDVPIANAQVTIYRAVDNQPAVVGVDLDPSDVNPVTTDTTGFYSFLTANANYYIRVEADGYDYPSTLSVFPAGRTIVTGSKAETFTVAGVIIEMDHPMDSNPDLLRIEKDANKAQAKIGEVVTYTITIQNLHSIPVLDVHILDTIPPGFKYLEGRVTLDGVPIANPVGQRPLDFTIGTVPANSTKTLKYQLVVGAGVTVGTYENSAVAQYTDGTAISNRATENVQIVLDPLFDLGTVIGKVFFDYNENGIQDAPEYVHIERDTVVEDPVPNVTIVMEDGTVIRTDKDGRFSIPAVTPGRHLLRVDERTLPEGSYLTTDKVVVIDVTQGLLVKANFGVNYDTNRVKTEDQEFFISNVSVLHDTQSPVARLNAALYTEKIKIHNDLFIEPAEFRIFLNYAPFIENWRLEILDADTKRSIRTFEGNRYNVYDPVFWDGRDNAGTIIRKDRNYEYRVIVDDGKGKYDETKPKAITLETITTREEVQAYKLDLEANRSSEDSTYREWMKSESAKSEFLIETILIEGETIRIEPLKGGLQSIRLMKGDEVITDIPISNTERLTARDVLEGRTQADAIPMEVIVPTGNYEVLVQQRESVDGVIIETEGGVVSGDGSSIAVAQPVKTYSKPVQIGEDRLFFVAMGDAKVGYTFTEGNIAPVEQSDKFRGGFWSEGKLAYYLKGKVKGKYLITSSFDSDREKKELFRNLDPEAYYPVYGDQSEKDYQATDTQGNLYLLLEWDKSSALWGNYEIGFDQTEFAKFSRTLYGGKVDFESVSSTKYGDSRSKIVLFRAKAQQKSAHAELLATGGSLYFLKHQDVTEGSDKVKIQIRDKITGLVITEKEMKEGADYEMDYDSGRMIFWRPVPILAEAYSIISSNLLDGNPIFVIVDYEYDVKDQVSEDSVGARVRQALTDEVLVGTTYVKEGQTTGDYELRGSDVTVRLGKDATLVAEVAETESATEGTYVSTDGGLSYTELATADDAQGRAYGIKGDARLFNRVGITSYYKWVDDEFSTAATTSQQGKEVKGVEIVFDITENTRLTARHDIQNLINDGNLQTQLQVGATRTATTLVQVVSQIRKLKITGEYRKQEVTEKKDQFVSETNTQEDILAVRADYEVTEKLGVSVEQQVSMQDEGSTQTTIGVTAKPTDKLTIGAAKTIGEKGVATVLDAKIDVTGKLALEGGYKLESSKDGAIKDVGTASVGASVKATDHLDLKTSVGVAGVFTEDQATTFALGGSSKIDDNTSMSSEVTMLTSAKDQATTVSFGGTSQVDEKTQTESKVSVTDSLVDGKSTSYTFGTKKQIREDLQLASTQTVGSGVSGESTENTYSLIREKDGKKMEGSLTRKYSENNVEVSRSNIFGLTGEIDDRWAVTGSFERGEVQNHDGTQTDRNALAMALGYVKKDEETGAELKSSTKIEARFDEGDVDRRQYLFYNSIEGQLTNEITLFGKTEFSKTLNLTTDATEAEHREMAFGGAYRPIRLDRLNLLSRYTYLENLAPSGQSNSAGIEEERAHVLSGEAVYDINDHWQLSEKYAYRINEEKVAGFDFAKTHTWLMIHRLNYKIDKDWSVGSEFRTLTQQEAEDVKRGFLIEASRRVGEYAQLGVGYNFTDFNDDLTALNYTAQGPFIRLTGKLYDRTPEEIERSRQKWLDEKIYIWAWVMVQEELSKLDSPILRELNQYYALADQARLAGSLEESQQIYRDVITAGEMMFEEAAEYIRGRIHKEEQLKEMKALADQYYKNGQYEKAKKILEKIVEEAENDM
jgi:hypothetical protein